MISASNLRAHLKKLVYRRVHKADCLEAAADTKKLQSPKGAKAEGGRLPDKALRGLLGTLGAYWVLFWPYWEPST